MSFRVIGNEVHEGEWVTLVWLVAMRQGVAYHDMPAGERKTPCGLWYGVVNNRRQPERGHILTEEEAESGGAVPCGKCWPDPGMRRLQQPVVRP